MTPDKMPADLRAEWDRLQDAFDGAEADGNADLATDLNEQIIAFAERHGLTDGCNFDPDADPAPTAAPTDPETIRRAMLQAAADGDDAAVEELKRLKADAPGS